MSEEKPLFQRCEKDPQSGLYEFGIRMRPWGQWESEEEYLKRAISMLTWMVMQHIKDQKRKTSDDEAKSGGIDVDNV